MTAMDIIRSVALRPRTQQYDVLEHYLAQAQRRSKFLRRGLLVLILLPTAVAAAYYGLWASKQYVSEARFIVRGISSPRTSGLDMFFRTFGISRTVDDTNAVQNYMLSRDAVRALVEQLPLRATFSRQEADAFARFPHVWRGDSFESLFEYYLDHVSVVQDPARGLTGLEVVTFRPEDSLQLAQALVGLAEG